MYQFFTYNVISGRGKGSMTSLMFTGIPTIHLAFAHSMICTMQDICNYAAPKPNHLYFFPKLFICLAQTWIIVLRWALTPFCKGSDVQLLRFPAVALWLHSSFDIALRVAIELHWILKREIPAFFVGFLWKCSMGIHSFSPVCKWHFYKNCFCHVFWGWRDLFNFHFVSELFWEDVLNYVFLGNWYELTVLKGPALTHLLFSWICSPAANHCLLDQNCRNLSELKWIFIKKMSLLNFAKRDKTEIWCNWSKTKNGKAGWNRVAVSSQVEPVVNERISMKLNDY